jgi:hypothetical protein
MSGCWGWGFILQLSIMDSVKHRRGQRLTWLKQVIAPLLGISLGLHGVLLLAPLPAPAPEEETLEEVPTEEEAVDLLSISSLATAIPAPEATTPAATAPPAAAPPPVASPPAPQAPAPYPENLPPPELLPEEDLITQGEPMQEPSPDPVIPAGTGNPPPGSGFDPNRQAQLVGSALGVLGRAPGSSNFDLTDQFPGDIWDLYISRWAEAQQQCFFNTIDRDGYALRAPAADLRYLSRNIQLVEQQDIPRTFAGQSVQPLATTYCEAGLFEVQDNGSPILWVSLVPVSPGGSTTLVIFWQADPRI